MAQKGMFCLLSCYFKPSWPLTLFLEIVTFSDLASTPIDSTTHISMDASFYPTLPSEFLLLFFCILWNGQPTAYNFLDTQQTSQQGHNFKTTSYRRQRDVMASRWRRYGIGSTSCACRNVTSKPSMRRCHEISGLVEKLFTCSVLLIRLVGRIILVAPWGHFYVTFTTSPCVLNPWNVAEAVLSASMIHMSTHEIIPNSLQIVVFIWHKSYRI